MSRPIESEPVPKRLGDFELVRELGRGGMGVVYEARQRSLNRNVALKVLSGGLGLTSTAVTRFRREAEAAAKLHHTNIVPVYATGEEDGIHYYAMELIAGPSLDQVIRQMRERASTAPAGTPPVRADGGPPSPVPDRAQDLPPALVQTCPYSSDPSAPGSASSNSTLLTSGGGYFDLVAHMIAGVADALNYAHKSGVIHRDIKPSNLLLSLPSPLEGPGVQGGRLSLNDFGLARVLEQPGMTQTGEFFGTPLYMSPEQITAGRTPLDHRTDIYSLGATLYELLTLQPPFRGQRRDEVLAQIIHKEPKPPRRVSKKVPVDLETICLKALEKDPDRRYQTAGQMAEDLRRYVNRFAITARRIGPLGRAIKWGRRHPALAATLVCAIVLAVVAGFFGYRFYVSEQQRLADQERHDAQLRTEKRQNALEKALLAAMSGDFEAAEKAVGEAEALGASQGQAHMLRGQVSLHRGDVSAAIEHLEQAVREMPESVAARANLVLAYFNTPMSARTEQLVRELEQMTPSTPEDYLFLGQAEALMHPERNLKTLDKAVGLRGSVIARAVRAEARANRALYSGDLAVAESALDDAQAARTMLPDNAFVLAKSVFAQLVASDIYKDQDRPEDAKRVLEQARRDVGELRQFLPSPIALNACFSYYDHVGDEDAALEISSLGPQYRHVIMLYRRGEFEKALEADKRNSSSLAAAEHCFVVAEVDSPARAQADLQKVHPRPHESSFIVHLSRPLGLLFLGKKQEAVQAGLQIRRDVAQAPTWRGEWDVKYLDCLCGLITEGELLQAAGIDRTKRCEAHFLIGLRRLADGDRKGARNHFEECSKTRVFVYWDYMWARAFLKRLEKDPTWPRWIEAKPRGVEELRP